MFLTVDDAKLAFAEVVDPPFVEVFAELLEPVTALIPFAQDAVPQGHHQIGGNPRAGAGLVWPAVDRAALFPDTLDAGHPAANAESRAHLDAGTPMAFIAQVELAELLDIPALAALPDHGRLLFFYDFPIGTYESSPNVGRVIWDQTDLGATTEIAPPEALLRAAKDARAFTRKLNAEFDGGEDWDGYSTIFAATARPAIIVSGLELPLIRRLDPEHAPSGLIAADRGETVDDDALDLLSQYEDAYYAGDDHLQVLRLLGQPAPEQDDPAYDAVVSSSFGKSFLSSEEWQENQDRIMAGAEGWTLLAQLDVAAWLDDRSDGKVYFMIRKDDLAAQRFDRVIPVYQQT